MKLDKNIVKSFIDFVVEELGIKKVPRIVLTTNKKGIKTTAVYRKRIEIKIYVKDRHLADVLRSIAHELVHHWQLEQGKFGDEQIQDVGGEIEDEANAVAGQLIKKFAYSGNMKIYEVQKKILKVLHEARLKKQIKHVVHDYARPLAQLLDIRPYELEKQSWDHYGLVVFKTPDGEKYAIGTDEEADAALDDSLEDIKSELKTYMEPNQLSYYIDNNCAYRWCADESHHFEEMIRENPEGWISKDPEQKTDYAEEELEKYNQDIQNWDEERRRIDHKLEALQGEKVEFEAQLEIADDDDADSIFEAIDSLDEEITELEERHDELTESIEEWESEIEDIMNDTENSDYWEYSEEQIESAVKDEVTECSDDLVGYLENIYGNVENSFDEIYSAVERCIDEDAFNNTIKRDSTRGELLNYYNGTENEVYFDGTTYYIYRV